MAKFKKGQEVLRNGSDDKLYTVVHVCENCDEYGSIDQAYKIHSIHGGAAIKVYENDLVLAHNDKPIDDPYHESILLEAEKLVNGDRNKDYGHPLEDFTKTAAFWTAYLQASTKSNIVVTAFDIPLMMILLKMSRELNLPKRDNKVDIAGYAETLQMCFDEADRLADAEVSFGKEQVAERTHGE